MTPFFSSTFYALFVTFIFIFENSQNSFWCGPPVGPFWSVKYLTFGQKLPVLRLLKIHIMFCPPSGARKMYQLMDCYSCSSYYISI